MNIDSQLLAPTLGFAPIEVDASDNRATNGSDFTFVWKRVSRGKPIHALSHLIVVS